MSKTIDDDDGAGFRETALEYSTQIILTHCLTPKSTLILLSTLTRACLHSSTMTFPTSIRNP